MNWVWALAGVFLVMCALDTVLTHLAVSLGGKEFNPIWRLLSRNSMGLHFLVKLGVACIVVFYVMRFAPEENRFFILLVLTIFMEVVVAWNLGQVWRKV